MNNSTAKLQIRIDKDLKESADEVFHELGLDAATAVRMFFTKVARTRSIPFKLKAEPEFSPEAEARILAAWEESKDPANLVGPFSNMKDFISHLRSSSSED